MQSGWPFADSVRFQEEHDPISFRLKKESLCKRIQSLILKQLKHSSSLRESLRTYEKVIYVLHFLTSFNNFCLFGHLMPSESNSCALLLKVIGVQNSHHFVIQSASCICFQLCLLQCICCVLLIYNWI